MRILWNQTHSLITQPDEAYIVNVTDEDDLTIARFAGYNKSYFGYGIARYEDGVLIRLHKD